MSIVLHRSGCETSLIRFCLRLLVVNNVFTLFFRFYSTVPLLMVLLLLFHLFSGSYDADIIFLASVAVTDLLSLFVFLSRGSSENSLSSLPG